MIDGRLRFLGILAFLGIGLVGCSTKSKPEVLNQRGSVEYQLAYDEYLRGDLIIALQHILNAVTAAPRNPDAKNLLGLVYFRQQKYELAEKAFRDAVTLDPKLAEVFNNLGTLYYAQHRYKEALVELNHALDNPLYVHPERIYNNIGLAQAALGNRDLAIQAYEESIQLKRDFYLPYQNLGKLFLDAAEFDKARPLLERSIALCEECSEPKFYMGTLLDKKHERLAALKVFKQGADVDPEGYFGQLCKQSLTK